MTSPRRRVTLVLCTVADGVLGVLPPFEVARPFWQEVDGVVAGASARYAVRVTVLRMLHAALETPPHGGDVTYLAEVDAADAGRVGAAVSPWLGPDPLADHPLRMPWARPGGPAADVGWALTALAAAGRTPSGAPEQVRTWNLSSLWRLRATDAGRSADAWLKVVPRFFGHEGLVLERLQGTAAVPLLLARGSGPAGSGRVLLDDVPGQDCYGAPADRVAGFARVLAAVQVGVAGQADDLVGAGVPDRRDPAVLVAEASRLVDLVATGDRGAGRLDPEQVDAARRLVDALPALLAREAGCGVPDSLVHADFHPGNVRGVPGSWRVLDWGDSYVGAPAVDLVTAADGFDAAGRRQVVEAAAEVWGDDVDLLGAAEAARPVAPLRAALAWQRFLDAIEPDERPYHEGDPAAGLRDALAAFR